MKKLVRPVRKVNTAVVGLDVHQDLIAYTWLDRQGDEVEHGSIPASRRSLLGLLDRVGEPMHVAFEAGGSTFWLFDLLVEHLSRERVHVAQPKKIRAIANSTQKNDTNDAWWLAYLTFEGRLPECFVPTGALRQLRIATRERFEVVKMRTRAIVRLRGLLRQMAVRLPTRKVVSIRSWNFLIDLCEGRDDVQGLAIARSLELLEVLEASREEWDRRIEQLAQELPEVQTLRREIPGVGKALAPVLVAEIGPVARFRTPKALGRYTGMTPSDRSSAGQPRFGAMTREGSEHLRWALTQAAMACLRSRSGPGLAAGNWIRAKQRRMQCKGKARVAAGRKIAEAIWRLFHWGECFDMARPFGGSPAPAN